jgi:hypothetical protein
MELSSQVSRASNACREKHMSAPTSTDTIHLRQHDTDPVQSDDATTERPTINETSWVGFWRLLTYTDDTGIRGSSIEIKALFCLQTFSATYNATNRSSC